MLLIHCKLCVFVLAVSAPVLHSNVVFFIMFYSLYSDEILIEFGNRRCVLTFK